MKELSAALLAGQQTLGQVPAVKFNLQTYDFPDKSDIVRYQSYNFVYAHHNSVSTSGAKACFASDGAFIMAYVDTNGDAHTARWATVDLSEDFSEWAATGTPSWHNPKIMYDATRTKITWAISANPTSAEVLLFRHRNYVYYHSGDENWKAYLQMHYKASADYGATWGAWTELHNELKGTDATEIGAYTLLAGYRTCSACHKSNGDVFVSMTETYKKRLSGSWDANWSGIGAVPERWVESAWVGNDVIIAYSLVATAGTMRQYTVGISGGTIDVSSATWEVNSIKDLTPLKIPSVFSGIAHNFMGMQERVRIGMFGKTAISSQDAADFGTSYGYIGILNLPNYGTLLATCDSNVDVIWQAQGTVTDRIYSEGFRIQNTLPLSICASDKWIIAYNGNQIYISPAPYYWSTPTIGDGAGSAGDDIPKTRIWQVRENVGNQSPSTLDIVLNNDDGEYDTAPTELDEGSRLNLYLGLTIAGEDEYEEYARYFVKNWGYTRRDNTGLFTIHCIDAWGLLEEYIFAVDVKFNIDSDDYTILDIAEMLVNAIGGTLDATAASADIQAIYPKLEVSAGDNAGNLMRRLLMLVPDTIKFFGNDGTIVNPQSTDESVYTYRFPVTEG